MEQDLPSLEPEHKHYALYSLSRCGLTFEDCRRYFATRRTEKELKAVATARELFHLAGELEVDADANVSLPTTSEGGCYVEVWLWVPTNRGEEK